MNEFDFNIEDFNKGIERGEIEFCYNEREYFICWHNKRINCSEVTDDKINNPLLDPIEYYYDTPQEVLDNYMIQGRYFRDIIPECEYFSY